MKLEVDGATARVVWARLRRVLVAVLSTAYALCQTLSAQALAAARTSGCWVVSNGSAVRGHAATLWSAARTRRLGRRLSHGAIGVHRDRSILAVVVTPLSALGSEWWVIESYGYRQIHTWVIGTWTGTNPQLLVFAGVATLAALPVAFTVLNSGLIPATLLAMGPIFGIGFARYGLTVAQYGTVGIPEATAFAGGLALLFGVPIGAAGFLLGTLLRKGVVHFRGNRGPGSRSWNVF